MERPIRETLRLWYPGMNRDDDYRVSRSIAYVRFLLGHRQCCLIQRSAAGTCNGTRFEDAGISSNFKHGAAFESTSTTLATLDQAFDALSYRLRRGALCLIRRGGQHIAPDGKAAPRMLSTLSWSKLGKFYRVRKDVLRQDAQDAAEAMALIMLDWVKVELPEQPA